VSWRRVANRCKGKRFDWERTEHAHNSLISHTAKLESIREGKLRSRKVMNESGKEGYRSFSIS
jgi:hypothetical protein